jgi:hypothetical protein
MQIQYDKNLKIAGIGLVPWSRLGPEKWFENYRIASLYGWDAAIEGGPQVTALHDTNPNVHLTRLNTQRLIDEPDFQRILRSQFSEYSLLTYKPVQPPAGLQDFRFIASNQTLAPQLENKVAFRRLMRHENIPFPAYSVYERQALKAADASKLLNGRESAVLQDERLSGGKGTFVIRDESSLAYALESLERMQGGAQVVVSDRILSAHERSVQCCVTRYGVFVGPLQKQIIANPLLANMDVADGDKFCGAEITPHDAYGAAYDEIKGYATRIGQKIMDRGYRGIFSVDCLLDAQGTVYILEINPRITGITPLLTMLYREGQDIPFYLLHILELLGVDYSITDDYIDPIGPEGSLLILHAQHSEAMQLVSSPASGLYDVDTVQLQAPAIGFSGPDQLLVQRYVPNLVVKPGGRLLAAYTNGRVLDDADDLLPATQKYIREIMNKVEVKTI